MTGKQFWLVNFGERIRVRYQGMTQVGDETTHYFYDADTNTTVWLKDQALQEPADLARGVQQHRTDFYLAHARN